MPRRFNPEPPVYAFRVRLPGAVDDEGNRYEEVWRVIEVAANQTLEDLGEAIPVAFDFDDPHLWSFFLSSKAWDRASEYALETEPDLFAGRGVRSARRVRIRDVVWPGARGRKEFLFLFDYGDQWHFRVKLLRTDEAVEAGASYPRVVERRGEAPPQYESEDDEDGPDQ
jgi:hypothetical protein